MTCQQKTTIGLDLIFNDIMNDLFFLMNSHPNHIMFQLIGVISVIK